jgi:hypothetical protein
MDVERLMRLKGTVEASKEAPLGPGLVASFGRIRAEVSEAVGPAYAQELNRLFPEELKTTGQPWGAQATEAQTLLGQMAGWLDGMIEAAILDRRIQADADAKARQTGFR